MTRSDAIPPATAHAPNANMAVSQAAVTAPDAFWQSTLDAIDTPICIIGNNRTIIRCNAAMARLAKLPLDSVIGRTCCELVHGSALPVPNCPHVRMLSSKKRESLEVRAGQTWLQEISHPMFDSNGSVTAAVHLFEDTTEARRARELLISKNAALEEIVAHIEDERSKLRENISANVTKLVLPILRKMTAQGAQAEYRELLEQSLKDLASTFGVGISSGETARLTAKEIEICVMIRSGMKNKDIARMQGTAVSTVETERKIIRRKLGLTNKDANLGGYLQRLG